MAEPGLALREVDARFEQMRGIAVAQEVRMLAWCDQAARPATEAAGDDLLSHLPSYWHHHVLTE